MATLRCPHQPSCPGCPRLATPGLPPEPLGRLKALAEQNGCAPPRLHTSPLTGFRHRARLAIRGRADAPKLGIFESGTHQAVHIPNCLVHHPLINRVAAQVRTALAREKIPTYSDNAHAGIARYVQIVIERETERAQVTLVTNGVSAEPVLKVFEHLQASLGSELHGAFWNGNPERSNAILGPHWAHLHGEPYVSDRSGNARTFYPPSAFGQSNMELAGQLAAQVRGFATDAARVTEYYAGVGAIGLGLAESATELHLNEVSEGSLAGLAAGIAALPEEQRSRVHVARGTASDHAQLVESSDVVIADPPRKGLDAALQRALVAHKPARFLYVSCDIDSFERDTTQLLASFRLASLDAYDLFPHTEHLETLGVFEAR